MVDKLKTGSIIVADPFMMDPNFKRAVVLITDYHPQSTIGFILNKTVKMNINQLVADFPEFESEVYYGGPVQTDTIHFLHTKGAAIKDSLKVCDGVYWGRDFEGLRSLVISQEITPKEVRFFVGYSGWSPGQIELELEEKSWILAGGDSTYVFKNYNKRDLWKQVLEHKGDHYSVIATFPDKITYN